MPQASREALATEIERDVLDAVRGLARAEGAGVDDLIDEALRDLIEKRRRAGLRPHVQAAYGESVERYGELYEKLAK